MIAGAAPVRRASALPCHRNNVHPTLLRHFKLTMTFRLTIRHPHPFRLTIRHPHPFRLTIRHPSATKVSTLMPPNHPLHPKIFRTRNLSFPYPQPYPQPHFPRFIPLREESKSRMTSRTKRPTTPTSKVIHWAESG